MTPREAIETAKQTVNGTASEPEAKPAKAWTPMQEAAHVQRELEKIDKREAAALANARARYEAERETVLAGISEKARRILDAAREA